MKISKGIITDITTNDDDVMTNLELVIQIKKDYGYKEITIGNTGKYTREMLEQLVKFDPRGRTCQIKLTDNGWVFDKLI